MPRQTGRATIVVMSATTRQTEPPHVLVAYATKHGSTCEVAETVSSILRERRANVDLRPAAEVDSLAPYDAIGRAHV